MMLYGNPADMGSQFAGLADEADHFSMSRFIF
jgi:hypothetical protein